MPATEAVFGEPAQTVIKHLTVYIFLFRLAFKNGGDFNYANHLIILEILVYIGLYRQFKGLDTITLISLSN